MEADDVTKQQKFTETVKSLETRCEKLPQTLRAQVKVCCHQALEDLVPQVSGREALLEHSAYKKLAFKDVTERFFERVDQGTEPEGAIHQMAMVNGSS